MKSVFVNQPSQVSGLGKHPSRFMSKTGQSRAAVDQKETNQQNQATNGNEWPAPLLCALPPAEMDCERAKKEKNDAGARVIHDERPANDRQRNLPAPPESAIF